MIERFERPVDLDENARIEKLDQGIFLEVISQKPSQAVEDETWSCVYGSFHPEVNSWELFYRQAVDAGAVRDDGCIVWDELTCFCAEFYGTPESLQDLSLSDLTNMLENGETVLCQLNDFVLADVRAESPVIRWCGSRGWIFRIWTTHLLLSAQAGAVWKLFL